MQIRKYETSDIPELAQIYLNSRLETFHWMPEGSFKLLDFFTHTLGEEIHVIMSDKVIAGFISVWKEDNFIHHLYIDSKFQKKGYGKKLLQHALKQMGRPASLKCVVQNERAVQFYKMNGWKTEEVGKDEMGPYFLFVLN